MRTTIRPTSSRDATRLHQVLTQSWGSTRMATRGRLVDVMTLPGFVAEHAAELLGYIAYEVRGGEMEISVLEGVAPGSGAGSALLASCVEAAISAGLTRVWLITTNDNLDALRFYQRRGFVLVALHRGAVADARATIKPEIPATGDHDIPLRDELELDLPRAEWSDFIERYAWPPT